MKKKKKELDVDVIGEQNNSLTKEELLAISAFIKKDNGTRKKIGNHKPKKLEQA